MGVVDIDRRSVAKLARDAAPGAIHYDRKLTGFGVRVGEGGTLSYFIEYRPGAGGRRMAKRRMVLGRESPAFRADAARAQAEKLLATVAHGSDPAANRQSIRQSATVDEIVERYLADKIEVTRKASTAVTFRSQFEKHIRPEIGRKLARDLCKADVTRLLRKIGATHRVTANRVAALLHAAIEYGKANELLPDDHPNPARAVDRFAENARERYLTTEEVGRLGDTLRQAESVGLPWEIDPAKKVKHAPRVENRRVIIDSGATAAIRLLLLTGCRLREVLDLRWEDLDFERGLAVLRDSKVGRRPVVLGRAALDILSGLPRTSAFVIPGSTPSDDSKHIVDAPRADLKKPWARIRAHAGLTGVRLHDLRHSFAATGAGAGVGLQLVGRLLGHSSPATTQRYAHLADDPLRRASDTVAAELSAAMAGKLS